MRVSGTGGPSAPAPVCQGSRSQPDRGQVQTASRLLTVLPPPRPLKRRREGETERVKGESASPLAPRELITAGAVRPRVLYALWLVRTSPPFPGYPRPPHPRPQDLTLNLRDRALPPTHTPALAQPSKLREARARASGYLRLFTRVGARVDTRVLLSRDVIKNKHGD